MLMRKSSNRQIVKSFVVALTVTALVGGMPAAVSLAGPMELVVNGSFEDTTNGANKFWGTAAQGGSEATGWTGGAGATPIQAIYTATGATTVGAVQFFSGTSFTQTVGLWDSSASPDGGNYFASDSAPENSQPLSQTISGLTAGHQYELTFDYAASQFHLFGTSYWTGATQSSWYFNLGATSLVHGQDLTGIAQTQVLAIPSQGFSGWYTETYDFTANTASEVLSFLAASPSTGLPPVALLDGVSLVDVTPSAVPEPSTFALAGSALFIGGIVALRRRAQLKTAAN